MALVVVLAHQLHRGAGERWLAMFERSDVGRWLNGLAAGGQLSRRSIQICRLVLRAALDDAVHTGAMRLSPAARVRCHATSPDPGPFAVGEVVGPRSGPSLPRVVVRASLGCAVAARRPLRAAAQRALALKWDDIDVVGRTVRIDEGLVDDGPNLVWTTTKNAHSRRTIPVDAATADRLAGHRREQLEERLLAGGSGRTTT